MSIETTTRGDPGSLSRLIQRQIYDGLRNEETSSERSRSMFQTLFSVSTCQLCIEFKTVYRKDIGRAFCRECRLIQKRDIIRK